MISLIHPSRGRPIKSVDAYHYWRAKAYDSDKVEHIISIDFDDPFKGEYDKLFDTSKPYEKLLFSHNKNVVEATNNAAKKSTGNILIYLSDDFKCPIHWDLLIKEKTKHLDGEWLLKVDDCLQPFNSEVLTIPIMSRALYERLGYFWNPEYNSMFVDTDLFEVCKRNNWLHYAPDLKFPHEHWVNKKAELDETYRRTEAHWDQGKEVFNRRKAAGFPV